jgi:phosphoribosylanthranilate isomerase
MTFIKICGITNLEDALLALDAGADALGFNFYVPSPRYIPPDAAQRIIEKLPATILTVGVFVNEKSPESVASVADEVGLGAVQLHGDETPEFCRQLANRYVIKALSVGSEFDPQRVKDYEVTAIMLDAFDRKLRGGTGQVIDWSIARRTKELVPKLFLAGGLSVENVRHAIAEVGPFGLDACSSLEITPGKKDAGRVRAFVTAARSNDRTG